MVNPYVGVAVVAAIGAVIAYFLFKNFLQRRRRLPQDKGPAPLPWYSPFFTNPFRRAQANMVHEQHEHERKEAQKDFLLSTFGKKEILSEDFVRLREIVHEYHHQKWSILTPKEQEVFAKLKRLVELPGQAVKLEAGVSSKVMKMNKEEREEVIKMLRQI